MATIRAFTTIEQSRKLAEILPLESADMVYRTLPGIKDNMPNQYIAAVPDVMSFASDIPCWSLAALLDVLPFPVLYMEMVGGLLLWSCESHLMEIDEVVKIEHYDNPVDACVAMIEKLHELKML